MSLLSFPSERQHAMTLWSVRFSRVIWGSPSAPPVPHCDLISISTTSLFVHGGEKKPAKFDSMLLEVNRLKQMCLLVGIGQGI